jgi:hypothetical protein
MKKLVLLPHLLVVAFLFALTLAGCTSSQVGTRARGSRVTAETAPSGDRGDDRVRRALENADMKYVQVSRGNFKVIIETARGRTHAVMIHSVTEQLGTLELREVWAIGWKGSSAPNRELSNRLLIDNGGTKIGAWELQEESENTFALFTAKVPAEIEEEQLITVVKGVAQTADKLEEEILKSDDL